MKKLLFHLFLVVFSLTVFSAETEFADFRAKAKKVVPLSDADYKLGMELMKVMKKQGMTKKLVVEKRKMLTEPVPYRTGRLWFSHKKWFDHNLFISRDMWEDTPYVFQERSLKKSMELIRLAGLDGFVPILAQDDSSIRFSVAAEKDTNPVKLQIVPRLYYGGTDNFVA